jgi:hypothetical protein
VGEVGFSVLRLSKLWREYVCTYIFGENSGVDALGFLDIVGVFEFAPELVLKPKKLIIAEVWRSRLGVQ